MLETELTAAKDKAIADMVHADEDKEPLYREAWEKEEGRLTELLDLQEPQPGGELEQGCFDKMASCGVLCRVLPPGLV